MGQGHNFIGRRRDKGYMERTGRLRRLPGEQTAETEALRFVFLFAFWRSIIFNKMAYFIFEFVFSSIFDRFYCFQQHGPIRFWFVSGSFFGLILCFQQLSRFVF